MTDNPYPDGSGMKLNMGRNTMHYELHTAWEEGYCAGLAARNDARWQWTIHICPKGHKSLEPPLNGVCWACWPGGRGPAEEHTEVRVVEILPEGTP